jgi:hypothetical protein
MSAYMVNRAHIDALVQVAIAGPRDAVGNILTPGWSSWPAPMRWYWSATGLAPFASATADDPDTVGSMLIRANLASIHARYPDTLEGGSIPGPTAHYWDEPYRFPAFGTGVRWLGTVEALKALAGYEYQSCEVDDWRNSEAAAFADVLRSHLIARLPGYDAADWEVSPAPVGVRS